MFKSTEAIIYYDNKGQVSGAEMVKGNKTYYLDGIGNLKGIKKEKVILSQSLCYSKQYKSPLD